MAEKTDEELIDDLLAEVGRAAGTWGFASYHSAKRMALSARVAALRATMNTPPLGWKLVPMKITEPMLLALNHYAQCTGYIEEGYEAMLKAAPSPEETKCEPC